MFAKWLKLPKNVQNDNKYSEVVINGSKKFLNKASKCLKCKKRVKVITKIFRNV